ncbi:MAG: regulatory protein RecX [Phycisphaeraceae bacterium]|nr:regulatory protein RecX [Phycisphaeraceae bacterium]MCW5754974.1 regulatory protein RecX [Phycisphaeraceae bacterium]
MNSGRSRSGHGRSSRSRRPGAQSPVAEVLFPLEFSANPSISGLKPDQSIAWPGVWVIVDGRRAAKLTPKGVADLGLRVGLAWTDDLARQVEAAAEEGAALREAYTALARRALSSADLGRRLARKGHAPGAIARAVEELTRRGVLDDARLTEQIVRSTLSRRVTSRREVEQKLRRRGIDTHQSKPSLDEAFAERDALADAYALAVQRLGRMETRLPAPTRSRRLFGLLARRGFPPDVCAEAVRRAMKELATLPNEDGGDTLCP